MRRPPESWIALIAVTAIALYLCWMMVRPFLAVLLWAAVLAIIAYPYYLRWRRRGRSSGLAAALTTAAVVVVVILPLSLLGLALVRQAVPAADAAQDAVSAMLDPESAWFKWLNQYVDLDQLRDPAFIGERVREYTLVIASRTVGLLGGALGVVAQIFFVLFTLFYLLRDADYVVAVLRSMLPLEDTEIDAVFRRTHDVISASLYGVLVIAAVQGALGALAFWVLGLPAPLLWGVVMFLLSMIPLAGSFVVWVPAALFLLVTGSWVRAMLLTIWGAGVIGVIDNVLRPRLVGERARMHELVVFFSVLGGLHVFGVLGLVIGPVVVAIAMSLFDVLRRAHYGRVTGTLAANPAARPPPSAPAAPLPAGLPAEPDAGPRPPDCTGSPTPPTPSPSPMPHLSPDR